jgi:hypothetical protein
MKTMGLRNPKMMQENSLQSFWSKIFGFCDNAALYPYEILWLGRLLELEFSIIERVFPFALIYDSLQKNYL